MGMMGQAIKKCGGQPFTAKHLHPIGKFEISGDDKGDPFIKLRAKSEQSLSACFRQGDETQLIEYKL